MPQTPEAQAFLSRIAALPKDVSVSLDEALQPSLDDEAELRRLFATDPKNSRLSNPHVGLVDVFDASADIRTTRARAVQNEFDLSEKHLMPLTEDRRRKEGSLAMASSIDEFNRNWSIFTEGSLSLLDWNNVIAAGGSVLACLLPVPDANKASKRTLRKYFHSTAFPTSDVDLFLYGLTPEQGEEKIIAIFQAIRDAIPWDCTCVRTKHSISIHSQYPYRCVQIVLRLYSSPSEILTGFDVDAPCCAFDGTRVWANPRSIVSLMRQANTVDITRRSPSYEVRLSKYSFRDFEVYIPSLKREEIDPTIFERSVARVEGLARLIVLERLYDPDSRESYLNARRRVRNRPEFYGSHRGKKSYKGDLKKNSTDEMLEASSYDVTSLHIPYGPGWHAKRIEKLVYQTDLGMNSPFNPKNKDRRLHRHPAFFGDIQECMEDCCEYCPEPKDDEEKELQQGEDEKYIRGRIQFIQEDPGRQSISGSFNPIDDGEWAEQAYIGEAEKLCKAIVSFDRVTVLQMIKEVDINRRDHVGRTPLHLAILTGASEIACDLIDAGARMMARLVDGRTALHLAAQLGLGRVIEKLLEKSELNKEEAEEEKTAKEAEEGKTAVDEDDPMDGTNKDEDEDAKSEDIGDDDDEDEEDDRGDDDYEVINREDANDGVVADANIPEDDEDEPDILDVNIPDWDYGLTPLGYAIVHGHLDVVDQLLVAESDPLQPVKSNSHNIPIVHPLALTVLTEDEEVACKIAERLIQAGATSSTADKALMSVFLRIVTAGRLKLLSTLFRVDSKAKKLVNFPTVQFGAAIFPTTAVVANGDFAALALLLAHGAKVMFKDEDLNAARSASDNHRLNGEANSVIQTPVETAVYHYDPVIFLLAGLGASLDIGIKDSYRNAWSSKASLLQAVRQVIKKVDEELESLKQQAELESMEVDNANQPEWKAWITKLHKAAENFEKKKNTSQRDNGRINECTRMRGYLEEVLELLKEKKAKTWNQLHPDAETKEEEDYTPQLQKQTIFFDVWTSSWQVVPTPQEKVPLYEELYEACWNGDDDKIRELCLPPPPGSMRKVAPIQIVCKAHEGGHTPLHVAIHRRHWSTANTILTIAAAQQRTKPEATSTVTFDTLDINLADSDEECGSEGTDDESEGDSDEKEEPTFIDLDRQDTQVRYEVGPDKLLKGLTAYLPTTEDDQVLYLAPFEEAIHNDDFEAFVQIAELSAKLPNPVILAELRCEDMLLSKNRVRLLDEYIRRTGNGIDVPQKKTGGTDDAPERPKGKEYWGLNVHGKKRRDLAARGDPNVWSNGGSRFPLVWRAAAFGGLDVLEYLKTDRPLAAYQYYFSMNPKEAKKADLPALESSISELLGWCANPSNETALNAALHWRELNSFKKLLDLNPTLLKPYSQKRHMITGQNLLLLAVRYDCTDEFIDYLLEQNISVTEYDLRSWNVLHVAADRNSRQLLHLLERVPREDVDSMLVQQSKPHLNTPLHLSVVKGNVDHVKALIALKTPALLLRDINGFTPFHLAVKLGYSKIASLLAETSPPEVLYMESAVGATALETASQRALLSRASGRLDDKCGPSGFRYGYNSVDTSRVPANSKELAEKAEALKATIDQLQKERRLTKGTKVTKALVAFADNMMTKATEMKVREVELEKKTKDEEVKSDPKPLEWDSRDTEETLAVVRKGIQEKPSMHRIPIHLADVQKSVEAALPKREVVRKAVREHEDGSELGDEAEDTQLQPSQKWLGNYSALDDLDGSRQ